MKNGILGHTGKALSINERAEADIKIHCETDAKEVH